MLSTHSQMGFKHEKNDDAIFAGLGDSCSVLMVCDGVSSTPRGGWVAELVCNYVRYVFEKDRSISLEKLKEVLVYVDWVSRQLGRGQAACTLSIVCIKGENAWIASLGDSPVLLCSNERFQENNLEWLVTKEGAKGLRAFVGMGKGLLDSLRYSEFKVQKGDWILVMSDGVGEILSTDELYDGFRKREFKSVARELCALAKSHGARDDLSVVALSL